MRRTLPIEAAAIVLLMLFSGALTRRPLGMRPGLSAVVPTPSTPAATLTSVPRVVVRTTQPPVVSEDAPVSDCPDSYIPEHIWYGKDQALWEWDRYWSGPTCVLKCVSRQCNQPGGLSGSRCGIVYMNSWGEDRPPWCILRR